MSLEKKYLKTKPVCKVKFELSKEQVGDAASVTLAGDFNDWDEQTLAMKRQKNGTYVVTLDLAPESEYQFRYLIDGERWENDSQADKYVPNNVCGQENSVVVV